MCTRVPSSVLDGPAGHQSGLTCGFRTEFSFVASIYELARVFGTFQTESGAEPTTYCSNVWAVQGRGHEVLASLNERELSQGSNRNAEE